MYVCNLHGKCVGVWCVVCGVWVGACVSDCFCILDTKATGYHFTAIALEALLPGGSRQHALVMHKAAWL